MRRKITDKSVQSAQMVDDFREVLKALGTLPDNMEQESESSTSKGISSLLFIAIVVILKGILVIPVLFTLGYYWSEATYLVKLDATQTAFSNVREILKELTKEKVYIEVFVTPTNSSAETRANAVTLVRQYASTTKAIEDASPWLPGHCSNFQQIRTAKAFIRSLGQNRYDPAMVKVNHNYKSFYSDVTDHLSTCLSKSFAEGVDEWVQPMDTVYLQLQQAYLMLTMFSAYCQVITQESQLFLQQHPQLVTTSNTYARTATRLARSITAIRSFMLGSSNNKLYNDTTEQTLNTLSDIANDSDTSVLSLDNSSSLYQALGRENFLYYLNDSDSVVEILQSFQGLLDPTKDNIFDEIRSSCPNSSEKLKEATELMDSAASEVMEQLQQRAVKLESLKPLIANMCLVTVLMSIFMSLPLFMGLKIHYSRRLNVMVKADKVLDEIYSSHKERLDELYLRLVPKCLMHLVCDRRKDKQKQSQTQEVVWTTFHPNPAHRENCDYIREVCVMSIIIPEMQAVLDLADLGQFFNILTQLFQMIDERVQAYDVFIIDHSHFSLTIGAGSMTPNISRCIMEVSNLALDLMSSCSDVEITFTFDHKIRPLIGIHAGPCTGFLTRTEQLYCRVVGNVVPVAIQHRDIAFANSILVSARTANILKSFALYELIGREFQLEEPRLLEGSCFLVGRAESNSNKNCGLLGDHGTFIELVTRPKYSFDSDVFYIPVGTQ